MIPSLLVRQLEANVERTYEKRNDGKHMEGEYFRNWVIFQKAKKEGITIRLSG